MFMHKPKGRLEKWIDRLSNSLDKWFDNREKKCANYAQESDEAVLLFTFGIDEALHLPPLDAKNPYRFL